MSGSREAKRRWSTLAAALLSLHNVPGFADDAAVQLQAKVDSIKQDALKLADRALALEDKDLDRSGPRTTVYLSTGNSGASIVAVSLAVDGAPPLVSSRLTTDESQALLRSRTTKRLARLTLAAGIHHVHAEIALRYSGDSDERNLALDKDLDIVSVPSDLLLAPEGNSWFSSPSLSLHRETPGLLEGEAGLDLTRIWNAVVDGSEVRDGVYRPGGDSDPNLGYASFLIATQDYFKAVAGLNRIAAGVPQAALSPAYYQALTSALIGYDALAPAREAYRQAVAKGINRADAEELRTRIGEAYYQRQDYARAEEAMERAPVRRDKTQFTQWQDLRSRILLAQSRFGDASEALKAANAGADFESYVRYYNLGIALIQNGFGAQGVTVLDRVGSVPGNDRDMQSLSDSANLALGSYLLRNGQGATAIPVLERIELRGLCSDRALLDLGWAWLAPPGTQQARAMIGDERTQGPPPETIAALHQPFDNQNLYQRYHLRPFVRAKPENDRDARIKRSLAIWAELIGRDASSDAVQEAYLAAALSLDQLGAHEQAAELFGRGITALEAARRAVDDARDYVRSDQWVGDVLAATDESTRFDKTLRALPRVGVAAQLDNYLADWSFQSGLHEYRELEAVSVNLAASVIGLGVGESPEDETDTDPDRAEVATLRHSVTELRRAIEAAKSDEVALLRQQLLDQLSIRQHRLLKLVEGARFEVARIYDGVSQ